MDRKMLERKFHKMGARVKFASAEEGTRRRPLTGDIRIDIQKDKKGEYFDIQMSQETRLVVLVQDVRPRDQHLLLMTRQLDVVPKDIRRFLCGHDERAWFVAAVPEDAPVSNVAQALEALKPEPVQDILEHKKVKRRRRNKRRNPGFVRQGEWFFIPRPGLEVDDTLVLHNEPLSRGRGKPHMAQRVYRHGGITVHVCRDHPAGLTAEQYHRLIRRDSGKKSLPWQVRQRDSEVHARGKITHPDHQTIELLFWHRVLPNTESRSRSMGNLAFLD